MKNRTLGLFGIAIAVLCGGCATSAPTPITHLYGGSPLPIEKVATLEGDTLEGDNGGEDRSRTTITAVDGNEVGGGPSSVLHGSHIYAVIPGSHTVTAYGGEALVVVANTGISTTPELRTSTGATEVLTLVKPGRTPVRIALDDQRLLQAREELESKTSRTVTFSAEAGKKYIVRCELAEDYSLTGRGLWVEELLIPNKR